MGSLIGQRLLLHLKEDRDTPQISRLSLSEWNVNLDLQMESMLSDPHDGERYPPYDHIPDSSRKTGPAMQANA